jgi:hypothetical protein
VLAKSPPTEKTGKHQGGVPVLVGESGDIQNPGSRTQHTRREADIPSVAMADGFAPRSMKRKNVKGLALKASTPQPPPTAENAAGAGARGDDNSAQLEIGIEFSLSLRPDDLEIIKDLGAGNGGTVSKVRHIPTNTVMARKVRLSSTFHPHFSLPMTVANGCSLLGCAQTWS